MEPTSGEMEEAKEALAIAIDEAVEFLTLSSDVVWPIADIHSFLKWNKLESVDALKELLLDHVNREAPLRAMANDINSRVFHFNTREKDPS